MTESAAQQIEHPTHYTQHPSGIECWEINQHMPPNLAAIYKYIWRRHDKDTVLGNLEKALQYTQKEIERRQAPGAMIYTLVQECLTQQKEVLYYERCKSINGTTDQRYAFDAFQFLYIAYENPFAIAQLQALSATLKRWIKYTQDNVQKEEDQLISDDVDKLIEVTEVFEEVINHYPFAYIEIARTKITDWMVYVHTFHKKNDPRFKEIAHSQELTMYEAVVEAVTQLEQNFADKGEKDA